MHPVLFHIGAVIVPAYGASAALGVLLALFLSQRTARIARVEPSRLWNLCVVSLFAALAAQRLLLVVLNLGALRLHPSWLLAIAMVHHPLLAAAGAVTAAGCATAYARWQKMPLRATADALAAPLTLGLAFEQLGALLAGSGFGVESAAPWAVTYSSQQAELWSGTPLGVPLHPVQAYAALAYLVLAVCLLLVQPALSRPGDLAGATLIGIGVAVYIVEIWRDSQGRIVLLNGALDSPQLGAILLVLAGALMLLERKSSRTAPKTKIEAQCD